MPVLRIAVALSGLVLSTAVCNAPQCPNPPLNLTALGPCLGQTIQPSCCSQIRPLASNACIRVWLKNPQIAPFQQQILKAGQACNITSLPECNPRVQSLCAAECASVPAGLGSNSSQNSSTAQSVPSPVTMCNASQCPLPNLNITAFAPCLGSNISQSCCAQARPLANNPCIRVWIQHPQIAPFHQHIIKAGQTCNITSLAECAPRVQSVCPQQCATVPNATNGTAGLIAPDNHNKTCPNQFEEWTDCHSSSCWESKCVDGKLQKPGPFCTADCRTGCRCKDGYARVNGTGSKAMGNTGAKGSMAAPRSDQTCIPEIQCGLGSTNTSAQCPQFMCSMFCPNGFMKDANGCNLCQCQKGKAGKSPKAKKAKGNMGGRR